MNTIKNFILGMLMGIANLVPGVSAGTIAIISGKYDDILTSASEFLSFKFSKKILLLLVPLFLGLIIAIFSFSSFIILLLDKYELYLMNTFVGLILGGLFLIFKEIDIKKATNLISFIVSLAIFSAIFFFMSGSAENNVSFINLFFGGIIGASAMVLPGISGSSMLLIMGVYEPILQGVSDFDFSILIPVAAGIVFGIVFIVKLLSYLLKNYYQIIMSILLALTLSGGLKILPLTDNYFSYLFIILGIIFGMLIDTFFKNNKRT